MTSAASLEARLDTLAAGLAQLDSLLREQLERASTKDRMFDAIHDELRLYRQQAQLVAQKRLLQGMLLFYDNLAAACDQTQGQTAQELEVVLDDFLGVLATEGVEPMVVECGEPFDAHRQKAMRRLATPDPSRDRTVAELGRRGFLWDGQVLRPAEVAVLRYQATDTPTQHD